MESFDGETVYFTSESSTEALDVKLDSSIYAISLKQPGTKSVLKEMPRVLSWNTWTMVPGGIYFAPADAPTSIRFFDFTTKQVRQVFKAEKSFENFLSVSPDGRWIVYSQMEEQTDIMLIEHFR